MANYKVWLTVKDRYGCEKRLPAGDIELDHGTLSDEELNKIKEDLPVYVPDVTPDNILEYTLERGKTEEKLKFDIDKSNDWNHIDNTTGSSFVWEPMC